MRADYAVGRHEAATEKRGVTNDRAQSEQRSRRKDSLSVLPKGVTGGVRTKYDPQLPYQTWYIILRDRRQMTPCPDDMNTELVREGRRERVIPMLWLPLVLRRPQHHMWRYDCIRLGGVAAQIILHSHAEGGKKLAVVVETKALGCLRSIRSSTCASRDGG